MTVISPFFFCAVSNFFEMLSLLFGFFIVPGAAALWLFKKQNQNVRIITFLASLLLSWPGLLISLFVVTLTDKNIGRK